AEVRRDHRAAADRVEAVKNGAAERGALGRVGAGAEFVEEHETAFVGGAEDAGDAGDVRAKGAERLFEALFVADVRENLLEHRHVAPLPGGDVHARLRHQAQRARRFEAHRFAAGVRSRDDEQVEAHTQADVDGYYRARWLLWRGGFVAEEVFEERVSGDAEPELAGGGDGGGGHLVVTAVAGRGRHEGG